MLISFSVSNYRSIKNKVTLSLIPVKSYKELTDNIVTVGKSKVLRSAVIYGANASGKSNVLKSIFDFIKLIKTSATNQINNKLTIYDPFLLDKKSVKKTTEFEIEFISEGIRYKYYVSYDSQKIHDERLYFFPKGQSVRIFERKDTVNFKYGTILKGEKKSIENRLLPNQLFLSKAANENIKLLINVYSYFDNYGDFYSSMLLFSEHFSIGTIIGSGLKEEGENFFNMFQKIITAFDVGIHSLKITKSKKDKVMSVFPEEASEIIKLSGITESMPDLKYELVSVHKIFDEESNKSDLIDFPLDRESAGTKNLLGLAFLLLDHFRKGSIMIIDEFEKSLHPQLVRKLVRLFHEPEINVNNAQLIFSTHAVSLLDDDLFRRDQIWFTEKDEQGITDLYSLSQIEGVRKDIPYDKWYESGRFGAIPIIEEPDLSINYGIQKRK